MATHPFEVKDPDAVLEYTHNWASWLDTDEISTSTWTADAGITVDSETETVTTATVWLSGGTAGTDYKVVNRIVTTGERTSDMTLNVYVRET